AVRTGGASAAARAAPRLEGDLLSRGASRAHRPPRRVRPGRRLSRALFRDDGSAATRTAAGRRLRRLPRRRPAREDRPRVDGALARGARPLSRSARDEPRLRAADAAQGARAREEGAAAEGGGAAAADRGRTRSQARLLDPGRGLAARRAGAVRPRHAVTREPAPPGLLPGATGHAADRRARRGPGGLEPPAVGAARLHALVRAARRAGAAAARVGADGSARGVSTLPTLQLGY